MKKILFTLVALLIAGCAMPTHAATKSAKSLTFAALTQSLPARNDFNVPAYFAPKIRTLKYFNNLNTTLINLGFTCDNKSVTREYDEGAEEYYDVTRASYSKKGSNGTIYVSYDADLEITFPTATEKNAFITTVKALGYIYKNGEYSLPGNDKYYYIGSTVKVNGNKVTIQELGGY